MDFSTIWCEKYRPSTLDEMVLSKDIRSLIERYRDQGSTNHLLLISSPGQGKTSLAKIIVKDVFKCDYLYINASDENGIDTVRTKIITFAQTKSLDGNGKIIILDELDNFTGDGMRALRNVMEEYASNTRFILTANYKHKIIDPIRSRCLSIDFNHDIRDVIRHCFNILVKENIKVSNEQKVLFAQLVKRNFPDFRKTLNELQRYSITGELLIKSSSVSDKFLDSVYDLIKTDVLRARKFIIEHDVEFQADYHELMKALLEYTYNLSVDPIKKRDLIIVIVEYMYRHSFVVDTEINCFGCLLSMSKLC